MLLPLFGRVRGALRRSGIAVVASAFTLSACQQNVDLAALQALGKSTAASQSSFASLANDFYESCIRTVGWQRAAEPAASPDVFTDCSEQAKAARQWQAANSIVTSYIASLGALAGGGSDPADFGLGNFVQAVSSIHPAAGKAVFTDDQQKAIVGAASSLITDYFNVRRRNELAKIVPAADDDLKKIIDTLEDAAKTNYVTQLTSERNAIKLFFEPNISRARPGLEQLLAFNYRSTERSETQVVDEKQAAVDHYIAALEQIKTTHHKISDAVKSDRRSDISGIVQGYLTQFGPELTALQKAFK